MTMHERHRAWIEARGIDPLLAEKFGLATTPQFGAHWLTVPSFEKGEIVNR